MKCKFDGQTHTKCDFLEGRLPKYFFQEICFSGGKQTIHKVTAAFIDKNCLPRTSLNEMKLKKIVSQNTVLLVSQITVILI